MIEKKTWKEMALELNHKNGELKQQIKAQAEIIKVYKDALEEISENKAMTILGSDENGNPEMAHQIGANKGFSQQAERADESLEKVRGMGCTMQQY